MPELIFTKEELERVHMTQDNEGREIVTVDVHGLKVKQAKRFLHNLISLEKKECTVSVIHGYNRGTAIKDMLSEDGGKLSSKIDQIVCDPFNLGLTHIKCRGLA